MHRREVLGMDVVDLAASGETMQTISNDLPTAIYSCLYYAHPEITNTFTLEKLSHSFYSN
jgi:uncharacterized protein (DUF433 family)